MAELALAFVLAHPAVTAPFIGPRTMEQLESQLDAIDYVVPPGVTLARADNGYLPPALQDPFLRSVAQADALQPAPNMLGRRNLSALAHGSGGMATGSPFLGEGRVQRPGA